jgi:hypothetical protein
VLWELKTFRLNNLIDMRNGSLRSLILMLIALNLGALALYVFIFLRIDMLRTRVVDNRIEHDTIARQQEKVGDRQRSAMEIEPLAAILRSALVPADGVIRFIETLETVARSTLVELNIQSVDVSAGDSSESEIISVDLSARGSFESVIRTIEILENMPVARTMARVRFERVSFEGEQGEWRASVMLRALKQK